MYVGNDLYCTCSWGAFLGHAVKFWTFVRHFWLCLIVLIFVLIVACNRNIIFVKGKGPSSNTFQDIVDYVPTFQWKCCTTIREPCSLSEIILHYRSSKTLKPNNLFRFAVYKIENHHRKCIIFQNSLLRVTLF